MNKCDINLGILFEVLHDLKNRFNLLQLFLFKYYFISSFIYKNSFSTILDVQEMSDNL